MKREYFLLSLIILLVILIPLAYCADANTPTSSTGEQTTKSSTLTNLKSKLGKENAPTIESGEWNIANGKLKWLRYIFGPIITSKGLNLTSSMVITFAVWLMIFISFSDILTNFSSFSKNISWTIGFCLAIVAANLKWTLTVITFLTGAFAILGTFSLFVALGGAFFAFLAINLGIAPLGNWVKNRRMMMQAENKAIEAQAAGIEIAGDLKGVKEIGKGMRN